MKLMKSLLALAALFCAVTFVSAADEAEMPKTLSELGQSPCEFLGGLSEFLSR